MSLKMAKRYFKIVSIVSHSERDNGLLIAEAHRESTPIPTYGRAVQF